MFRFENVACKALPLVGEWDRPFHNGINKNACRLSLVNVMAKSAGRVHHISRADTLDQISLVNTKKIKIINSLMRF